MADPDQLRLAEIMSVESLRRDLANAQKAIAAAKEEAAQYRKLYESATKRKHEIYLCLVHAKRALEEAI